MNQQMRYQRTILLALGVTFTIFAHGAPLPTNEVHQKALDVLKKTMDNMEGRQGTPGAATKPASRPALQEPTFAEVEQIYLQGKISAKEFQKYLDDHKTAPAKLPNRDPQAKALEVLKKTESETAKTASTAPKPEVVSAKADTP